MAVASAGAYARLRSRSYFTGMGSDGGRSGGAVDLADLKQASEPYLVGDRDGESDAAWAIALVNRCCVR